VIHHERGQQNRQQQRYARAWAGATILLGAAVMLSGCHVDMWRQPRVRAYGDFEFFADRQGSRPLVPGTVSREAGIRSDDPGYFTGKVNGKPIKTIPVRAVQAFKSPKDMLLRGQDRFMAYCTPCHGQTGNGNGFITERGLGYWQKLPASYHTNRLRKVEDGHIYDTLTNGFGIMYGYGSRIQDVNDRWAVVAYVRALQLTHAGQPSQGPATPDNPNPPTAATPTTPTPTEGGAVTPPGPAAPPTSPETGGRINP
jgi:mono/diheme cytochrome c family protein